MWLLLFPQLMDAFMVSVGYRPYLMVWHSVILGAIMSRCWVVTSWRYNSSPEAPAYWSRTGPSTWERRRNG